MPTRTKPKRATGAEAKAKQKQKELEKAMTPLPENNPPLAKENMLNVKPGDNTKYVLATLEVSSMPDISLSDPEQVGDRISEYIQCCAKYDMKPTVNGLGLALGLDRRRLWEIKRDISTREGLPQASKDLIKKAYRFLENLWENYMQNGKINPVAGIFLGKNLYDYTNKQEHVIVPASPLGEIQDRDELARRYLEAVPASDYDAQASDFGAQASDYGTEA